MRTRFDFSPARRAVLLKTGALGLVAATAGWAQSSAESGRTTVSIEHVLVDTAEGRLRGQRLKGVCIFRGVRYANAPLGVARFKAAPPLARWKGVRDALTWGHPALQVRGQTFGGGEPAPDEDCLVLN